MITIYIGRHGETDLNSEERLRGWIDEPLNKDGIKEAKVMAKLMKNYPIDKIYCSDLDRADHTASIVAKEHDLKTLPREWFRPINYGDWNGKPIKEIKDKMQELLEAWKTDPNKKSPGGEPFSDFQNRNIGGLQSIVAAAEDGEEIMIVAHLRNCLLFWALSKNQGPLYGDALDLMDDKQFHQDSGEVSKYEFNGKLEYKGKL